MISKFDHLFSSKKMINRENSIGKTNYNCYFFEKYEKCEKIHKNRVLASYHVFWFEFQSEAFCSRRGEFFYRYQEIDNANRSSTWRLSGIPL